MKALGRGRDIHVFRNAKADRWVVVSRRRVLSRHLTQHTAAANGKRAARRRRVDLVIHRLDGRIRSKDSYGNESPRRDRER